MLLMTNRTILLSGLLFLSLLSFSGKEAEDQKLFIVIYTPGENWNNSKQPQEQDYFNFHSKRLQAYRKEGKILLGARYSNKGMIIMPAETEEEIKKIVFADSAVLAKTFNAEVFPYNVFYDGCIKR